MTNSTPESTRTKDLENLKSDVKPQDSYVKLAMRNMVKKRGTSLKHFFLTTFALLGFLVGISYLTR
ncbi:hypothetical protein GM3708_819 [Geminocystis sp. NIES-3708]|uniref:DUF3285 domain-containing protein n=1 Tax=Geminocystis sp. NIES-3708 TaxID=1615909 RepID=UPI0005FCB56F|nr:DUF3285 domain-containing protein [Geminocystis sp. NIES-3708]BAQ60413.1 hypothetical protein GM3708_819 [Geminocystis sp. NIES-3708]